MLPGLAWPGPGHGLARPWPSGAWGEASGAGPGTLGTPRPWGPETLATPGPRHWLRPKRHLAMAWPWPGPKTAKTVEKLKNRLFHKNLFFCNFKLNVGGLGVSEGMAWTMRCDSLELWQDLVLHGMGEVDFHVFGNIGNSLQHQIPPNWS